MIFAKKPKCQLEVPVAKKMFRIYSTTNFTYHKNLQFAKNMHNCDTTHIQLMTITFFQQKQTNMGKNSFNFLRPNDLENCSYMSLKESMKYHQINKYLN